MGQAFKPPSAVLYCLTQRLGNRTGVDASPFWETKDTLILNWSCWVRYLVNIMRGSSGRGIELRMKPWAVALVTSLARSLMSRYNSEEGAASLSSNSLISSSRKHVTFTTSPGWRFSSKDSIESSLVTGSPSMAMMTSPR